ncbi:MAG: elongation factor G [Planctomycetes bacterium]|nr:elongation factor G [Planctomycetota bacterium]
MSHRPEDVRNVALVGAGGAGKTTLTEAALFLSKAIARKGTVEDGNTVSDFDPDEKERRQSVSASVVHGTWNNARVQLIDAPGAADFVGEPTAAMCAVETVAIAVTAKDGVGVTARRRFHDAGKLGLVRVVVLTKIDQENIDHAALTASLQANFGEHVIPLNFPDQFGPGVTRIYNVFAEDLPEEVKPRAMELRKQVTEAVVECDDALIEKYFSEGAVTKEELFHAFPKAIRTGHIVPVLHTSSAKEMGARQFLDFVVNETPSPAEGVVRAAKKPDGSAADPDPKGPFAAQVFKIVVDPHVGKVAFLRVWSGHLASKSSFVVARSGKTERIGDLLEVQGKDLKPVASAQAGDIVAVTKVDDIHVGDTVTDGHAGFVFDPIPFPRAQVTLAVEPKNRADEAKLIPELSKLHEADPTFVPERDPATHEFVIRGVSSLHLDVTLKRLARKKVEVVTKPPTVPYRETVSIKGQGEHRHKKQSGGRGQFAEVHLKLEPLPRGTGFEFVDAVIGGTIPRQFIPAVEKGVRDVLPHGVVAGYPFTDVRAIVHFGKFHDVDSDEFSFKLAAGLAFKAAVEASRPILLEPIMDVEIEIPSRFMGEISGDLNSRRGRIVGMDTEGDLTKIHAQVPLPEMLNYSTELRSITAGEGEFRADLARYDRVPPPLDEQVIAKHKKEREAAAAHGHH